jgi:hypothetical protein
MLFSSNRVQGLNDASTSRHERENTLPLVQRMLRLAENAGCDVNGVVRRHGHQISLVHDLQERLHGLRLFCVLTALFGAHDPNVSAREHPVQAGHVFTVLGRSHQLTRPGVVDFQIRPS